ncbi:hypothetical protein GOODEAATRI_019091 [Goodea atripinnis]|uniref:Uncharacterized protein n=1 Tax=Goodea atripinnis TaxID=208336 RepID=A0ABV0PPW0_9TELE
MGPSFTWLLSAGGWGWGAEGDTTRRDLDRTKGLLVKFYWLFGEKYSVYPGNIYELDGLTTSFQGSLTTTGATQLTPLYYLERYSSYCLRFVYNLNICLLLNQIFL